MLRVLVFGVFGFFSFVVVEVERKKKKNADGLEFKKRTKPKHPLSHTPVRPGVHQALPVSGVDVEDERLSLLETAERASLGRGVVLVNDAIGRDDGLMLLP